MLLPAWLDPLRRTCVCDVVCVLIEFLSNRGIRPCYSSSHSMLLALVLAREGSTTLVTVTSDYRISCTRACLSVA